MHIHRPYCQHVIPLTYDNSLSYYEVLCKVIKRLNEVYADTENIVESVLEEMGLTDAVRYRTVYNVKDYGATGDGTTDDRWGIQNALNAAFEAGGGIVYVPEGHYMVSRTIVIGKNCSLVGSGKGTVIEDYDNDQFWGTCVCIVGSNAACCNMKLLYNEQANLTEPIVNGPAWGAIGCTNCDYSTAVNQGNSGAKSPIENIVMADLWTEGWYGVQVEPVDTITNVLYKNLHCEGGIVSIQGGSRMPNSTVYGKLKNVTMDNIHCDYFRILGGNYVQDVFVNNLFTHYIYTTGNNVHFNNFIADCRVQSDFDGAGFPINNMCCQFVNLTNVDTTPSRCSASNGKIIGRETNDLRVGLTYQATSKYTFTNIDIKGFHATIDDLEPRNIAGASGADVIFIGCDAAEDGITNSPVGFGIANNMGAAYTANVGIWSDVYEDYEGTYTFGEGFTGAVSTAFNNHLIKNGNVICGTIAASKPDAGLALNDHIATFQFKPSKILYFVATMVSATADVPTSPVILKLDTNGVLTLAHNMLHSPSFYRVIVCSFTYTITRG